MNTLGVSLFAAFIGGALTLLPACGPALLPAFFAYSFKEKTRLLRATVLFGIGFSVIFIPFGLSVSWLVRDLFAYRQELYVAVGIVLILFGLIELFGLRLWSPAPARIGKDKTSTKSLLLLGATFGITVGSCSAPIFGAIVTLAAGQEMWRSLLLLLTFELGMFAPLFLLAWLFESYKVFRWNWLRGTGVQFKLGSRTIRLYSTNIIAGLLFIVLGSIVISNRVEGWFNFLAHAQAIQLWLYRVNIGLMRVSGGEALPFWFSLGLIAIVFIFMGYNKRWK